ncbi:MAG TPA: LacI family DNA-binding transcriptional regulator [Candidatus Dormibacteraeota bacterium]
MAAIAKPRVASTINGDEPATIRDVSRIARVSLSSVSRVLTNHPDVSPRMRERVLKAVSGLGYEPHLIAQSLRRGRTNTLGFLIGDIANPVFADVIRGAEDCARERGYAVMLTNSEGEARLDAEYLRLFLRRKVDGILLVTSETGTAEIIQSASNPAVPYVILDRDVPKGSDASAVFCDHAVGMQEATAHLLSRGHRNIALLSGPPALRPARARAEGYRSAFRAAGLKVPEQLIRTGNLAPDFGKQEVMRLLGSADPPSAIIAGGNRLLGGVLEAAHQAGRVIGRDLALVSCDDVDLTRLYRPPISVVIRDMYEMGRLAGNLLLERINDSDAPARNITLPTHLVVRGSSDFAWATARLR